MKEIKFRAWDKKRKFMIYEDTPPYNFEMYLDGSFCIHRYDKRRDDKKEYWYSEDSEDYELMQYTGLKDKNGKEIYEGDILKDDVGIAEVTYDNERAGFYAWFKKPVVFPDYAHGVKDTKINQIHMYAWSTDDYKTSAEVIGNIYENPELIK